MLPTSVIEEESGKSKSNDVTDSSAESLRKRDDQAIHDRQDKTRQDPHALPREGAELHGGPMAG